MSSLLQQIAADVNVLGPIEALQEAYDINVLRVRSAPGLTNHQRLMMVKDLEIDTFAAALAITMQDSDVNVDCIDTLSRALEIERDRARNWESVCRSLAHLIMDKSSSRETLRDAAEGVIKIRSASA